MDAAWRPQPQAASLIDELVTSIVAECPFVARLTERMGAETGTRLIDWIDHVSYPHDDTLANRLERVGFVSDSAADDVGQAWSHPGGLFPQVLLRESSTRQLAVRLDSVVDFVVAHQLADGAVVDGAPLSMLRRARAVVSGNNELHVVERHGSQAFEVSPEESVDPEREGRIRNLFESFRLRRRRFEGSDEGFQHTKRILQPALSDLDQAHVCDLFFEAERGYWQSRNRAGRTQKFRQDGLGLGWGNHDHHTYRSSRECFSQLVEVLELLGFVCRERFYAGREAGWGAQVLEHPACGIVIFADVDLSPEEVTGDFAHEPLAPREELGTVGLWCKLHGEAFLEAGLHHLECQFDFDAAREQLRRCGIETMAPFTDLPHLRQAFTTGESWPVAESRLDALLGSGRITPQSAEKFRADGAIGSHLEILERNDGFKGFNQTGINDIIRETDPRRQAQMPQQ